jgi:hypothetical protein
MFVMQVSQMVYLATWRHLCPYNPISLKGARASGRNYRRCMTEKLRCGPSAFLILQKKLCCLIAVARLVVVVAPFLFISALVVDDCLAVV